MRHGGFGVRESGPLLAVFVALVLPASSTAAIQPGLHFGSNGSGAGQFQIPVSIEVGPNGNIYVGDAITNRVSQFAADGTFIRAWGGNVIPGGGTGFEKCTTATGCQNGSQGGDAGELQSADGIAAAPNGDLYVTEFSDHRVSQFTADGDFIRMWGWGVDTGANAFETCTSGCQAGSLGNGLGQLASPNSVAVAGGEVYVTETSGHRVSRFTTAGTPLGSFGSFGSGAGQLWGPRGIAETAGGNLAVVDRANNRVSEFTSTGGLVRAWGFGVRTGANAFETCDSGSGCQAGIPGAAAGQLSDGDAGEGVLGIGVNALGDVLLGDDGNNRIAQYAPTPAFTRAWGFDVAPPNDPVDVFEECTVPTGCQQAQASADPGGVANPADLTIDAFGRVVVVDYQTDRVVRYADPPPAAPTITGTSPGSPSNDNDPEVTGTAGAGLTVKIYATPDCTGPPLATGTATLFASPGITTPVPPDAITNLRSTATDALNNPSACSAPFAYTEDSTAPTSPQITATNPASPADDNSPEASGTAEAGSTVRVFSTADCSGPPLTTGSATEFASPGLTVAVADNSTTDLRATATDGVGNQSACSASLQYVEQSAGGGGGGGGGGAGGDTTAPETRIDSAPAAKIKTTKKKVSISISFSANEPATFRCSLDGAAAQSCSTPFKAKVGKGSHTFEVTATDTAGNPDPTPARTSFKVKRKQRRR